MNDELQNYLKDYWEHILKFNPTFATYTGDHRYNDMLEDLSEESIAQQIEYFKIILRQTENIDDTLLTEENKLNSQLLKNTLNNHIQMFDYKTHYVPLDHMQGPHIDFPQLIEFHPFKTRKDIDTYIARLKAFPQQIEQIIQLLEEGIKLKITAFNKIIQHVMTQVETFAHFSPGDNPLFSPVLKIEDGFTAQDKEEIRNLVKEAISDGVTPAYKKLHQYLSSEYLKHCREKEGVWSLPDGSDMYRFYVKYHTTTDLSPEEIHKIGKAEVARIKGEINTVMGKIGFTGTIRGFADYVKEKKELYAETGQEILDAYRGILSRMDKRLPDFFGRLPRAKYDIKEIEKYREKAAPAAYYYPPPRDFSRPGYFYANTYNPGQRPKYDMEALSYHEAVPGHHLQIAIMQELDDIPEFRRHEGSTAFIEGWALYAEKLSQEMGFYKDGFSEYGKLSFELWRAVRLVVDTGLHFYKWNRDETIQYCKENTGLEDHEITVEVDRYIAMPGQALAYKTGELKILELRQKAKNLIGSEFDIRDFHDRLLEHGALPLNVLENVMNDWMEGK
jgi:uncharacterized protein (DUF885 family)